MSSDSLNLKFKVLTPSRWKDLEKLFGGRGACGGCWCMWWKLSRKDFEKQKGGKNKKAFMKIVSNGERPGILAYYKNEPIGWCAVAPRDKYPLLENSRVLRRFDDEQVWSIVCFFIEKSFRKKGVAVKLIKSAVNFVKRSGGKIIEGYPIEPKKKTADVFAWTGFASAFRKAEFTEVARRSPTRPIMRFFLTK
ncbi:MAG: GNAT family N-acetyltransferase [Bacteroidetes bacterium]|nr:GNAT family N-acetyltransferase [Bacteroidota bacterium]MBU2584536.1 GNAT family N-acetyltransferase [Bacteroidota bacterium]